MGQATDLDPVSEFIARWQGNEGGAERANYGLFLTELTDLLGVAHPDPAGATTEHNDYVFERAVKFRDGGTGRVDLYKRGCFILEAKQSRQMGRPKAVPGQDHLFTADDVETGRGRRGTGRAWDVLMMNARQQAEDYARRLPASHDWPPFILVCDVGHVIEVYADFTGKGRNYTQFPDRQGFRIYLEDLRREEIRERLRLIWTEPHALDPTKKAARTTREIAARLAAVSRHLETRGCDPETVAHFLMRCLFTMFAEDVKLLPEDSFKSVLERCRDKPENFPRMVGQLWEAMNRGDFAFAIETKVKRFNGEFFRDTTALPLDREEIGELYAAASANWKEVEPAIFGTLLEQALDPAERKRLGAHYTPRAYVERLVLPTIVEPLREDWRNVQTAAEELKAAGKDRQAIETVRGFHRKLCATRVLDPACGTGNFLYVSMELMKRLEGEVLEALADLGGQEALRLEKETIDPHQFLGLELNPRAVAIAELVLWIGFLQWHFRTRGEAPGEPILKAFRNIRHMDAVLTWDGWPVPVIVDGKETYPNARRPEWPEAEFIVGIGGKDIRSRLGDGYAAALWGVHKQINRSADYVMYRWDRAADVLTRKGVVSRRFGLVTTNSVSQVFQRRVVERRLEARRPISLVLGIPDHPWTKATAEAAAVRIAMTVAQAGRGSGVVCEVVHEAQLDTDDPVIVLRDSKGQINSDLSIGADLSTAIPLRSNKGLAFRGVTLAGDGFLLSREAARTFGYYDGIAKWPIRPFANGRDLAQRSRSLFVIDTFGLSEEQFRAEHPRLWQHLQLTVKPKRDKQFARSTTADAKSYAEKWWLFAKPREELREALENKGRFIVTSRTARHRLFQFVSRELIPESELIAIAVNDPYVLAVLSSHPHVVWATTAGGWMGVGNDPRYTHSRTFSPFPFPSPISEICERLGKTAEELDATRKRVLDEHADLTLTKLYNVLERIKAIEAAQRAPTLSRGERVSPKATGEDVQRSDASPEPSTAESPHPAASQPPSPHGRGLVPPLTEKEQDIRDRGLVLIVKELHETIDRLVAEAYGWPADLTDEEILAKLVALNRERAEEERRGIVRWLRPDYQIPRFGTPKEKAEQIEAELPEIAAKEQKPALPRPEVERTAAVFAMLASSADPIDASALASRFRQGRRVEPQVRATLLALARMGHVASADGGRTFQMRPSG
jgi:SAM-dependent methyltransferase